jgi:excisionase family DNA binding protein
VENLEGLLSPREVAELFKVSVPTVYAWASRGVIPHYKLGTVVRFSPDDVLKFLQERRKVGQKSVIKQGNP